MRHFHDRNAIAEVIADMFDQHGARVERRDGVRYALFFDDDPCAPMPVCRVNIDELAADIELSHVGSALDTKGNDDG